MSKSGKIAWYGVIAIIVLVVVFDLWLDRNSAQETISQMAFRRAREDPVIFFIVGGLFVWLYIHLFWRWKNALEWLKKLFKKK